MQSATKRELECLPDTIDFKTKNVISNKEEYFTMIVNPARRHNNYKHILQRILTYIKQKLPKMKEKIDN